MPRKILCTFQHRMSEFRDAFSRRISAWRRTTLLAPLEGILQPSSGRLKAVGLFILISQPLIGIAWSLSAPQPYENLWLRFLLGALGALLIWKPVSGSPESDFAAKVATFVFWIELPLFGFWMYFCNGGNTEWFVSLCCMVLIYYHLTDWRIATGGVIGSGILAWVAKQSFAASLPEVPPPPFASHAMLFVFCWFSAITLGASAANLRREHIRNTLHAMVVLAQGLRTTVATAGAIADKLQTEGFKREGEAAMRAAADRLGSQLHTLVRQINHRLDTHVTNAGILQVANHSQRVSAFEVLQEAVAAYPYEHLEQRLYVRLSVDKDFEFHSSFTQFAQGMNNLLTNSFRAIEQKFRSRRQSSGVISIHISTRGAIGLIKIVDNGIGIPEAVRDRILEPFFTTHGVSSLGLGLPFVERVVQNAGGHVEVDSIDGEGTSVTLRLPCLESTRSELHPVAHV